MWYTLLSPLRDPLWQFIGVVIAALAFSASIWLYLKQRNQRAIAYKIFFKTSVHSKPAIICLKIKNSGYAPISSDDFERSIMFDFGGNTSILNASIIKTKPIDIMKYATMIKKRDSISLDPLLLNPGDTVYIEIELDHFVKPIPSCRIVGVTNVSTIFNRTLRMIGKAIVICISLGVLLEFIIFWRYPVPDSSSTTSNPMLNIEKYLGTFNTLYLIFLIIMLASFSIGLLLGPFLDIFKNQRCDGVCFFYYQSISQYNRGISR